MFNSITNSHLPRQLGAYLKLHFLRNVKPLGAEPDYSGRRPNLRVSPTGFLQSDLAAKLKIDEF